MKLFNLTAAAFVFATAVNAAFKQVKTLSTELPAGYTATIDLGKVTSANGKTDLNDLSINSKGSDEKPYINVQTDLA
jgi:hypothetical protein